MKTKLLTDLERKFGDALYRSSLDVNDYRPNPHDIIDFYRILDADMFSGKLPKITLQMRQAKNGSALAAFAFGVYKNDPVAMVIFDAASSVSLYYMMNMVIHESIHAYDWAAGPLNRMYKEWTKLQGINMVSPFTMRQTQFTYPADAPSVFDAFRINAAYDCHAGWFLDQAARFNEQGFDVRDMFDPLTAKRRLGENEAVKRTLNEDPDETPVDLRHMPGAEPVMALFDAITDDEHKSLTFVDSENWFIELS